MVWTSHLYTYNTVYKGLQTPDRRSVDASTLSRKFVHLNNSILKVRNRFYVELGKTDHWYGGGLTARPSWPLGFRGGGGGGGGVQTAPAPSMQIPSKYSGNSQPISTEVETDL